MRKAVSNTSGSPITLGGVEVKSGSKLFIREEAITKDEMAEIAKQGAIVKIGYESIKVFKPEEKPEDTKGKKDTKDVEHVAYPAELIKQDGTLNGSNAVKAEVKALQEEFGDKLLTDVEFTEQYPDADIEEYRVKVG